MIRSFTNLYFQNHSVQHFVYTLGNSSQIELLAQVADQNNMKLNRSGGVVVQPWPQVNDSQVREKYMENKIFSRSGKSWGILWVAREI